jgi:hypothetical protein
VFSDRIGTFFHLIVDEEIIASPDSDSQGNPIVAVLSSMRTATIQAHKCLISLCDPPEAIPNILSPEIQIRE